MFERTHVTERECLEMQKDYLAFICTFVLFKSILPSFLKNIKFYYASSKKHIYRIKVGDPEGNFCAWRN